MDCKDTIPAYVDWRACTRKRITGNEMEAGREPQKMRRMQEEIHRE
jgi:hypothetical protein